MIYLTPWQLDQSDNSYNRNNIGSGGAVASIYFIPSYNKKWYVVRSDKPSIISNRMGGFETKEEAMEFCDNKLIEDGYVLLSEEEYDKVSVLV